MRGKRVPDDLVDENPGHVVDVAVFIPPAQRLDNPVFLRGHVFLGGGEFRHPPKDQLPDVIVTCFALCLVELSFFLRPHRPVIRPAAIG